MKKVKKRSFFRNIVQTHPVACIINILVRWQPIDRQLIYRQLIDHDNSSTGLRNNNWSMTTHRQSTHQQAPQHLIDWPEASLGACQKPPLVAPGRLLGYAPVGALLGGHLAISLPPSPSFAARVRVLFASVIHELRFTCSWITLLLASWS